MYLIRNINGRYCNSGILQFHKTFKVEKRLKSLKYIHSLVKISNRGKFIFFVNSDIDGDFSELLSIITFIASANSDSR